ncbi:MAG: hypothetical protein KGI00_04260 [Candidatus Micrarchaeota archaeon]|nr:hypothetical protein [Candidatus Micrarchaeota archaeon]MDE1849913.1 hypothetical protein [Candidatus Micrarchaeota archaeon]
MELNVGKESDNRLLGRKEIEVRASFDAVTPSREELKEAICRKLGIHPDLAEVVRIDQSYGVKECSVLVYSYDNKESMAKGFRKKAKEGKKAVAAPDAAPKPAQEKEEAKEERKEEKKDEKKE